ncbi:MAG: oligopeptide ABC transporter permease OppB [Azospirillaceae bacterium]
MLSYTIRRLIVAIPTMLVIISIAFFMMRVAPGGPFDQERALPPAVEANIAARYNLDRTLPEQYLIYLGNVLQGDFGPSLRNRDFSVNELIAAGFPASIRVGLSALILAAVIGVTLGTLAALRQNTRTDYAVMATAMTGIAVPNFVMAPILTLIFGIWLNLLPVGGWGGGSIENLILPIVALGLPQLAIFARLTRGSMIEVLRSNYIRTARAKGLPERVTVMRHALKGALLPVVSYIGPATAALITGSVVIEQIFEIPGIGRYFVQGALNRDYTLVMATVILYGGLIILFNLAVDLVYSLLDPKVRYS